jgi:hypothetical protein
LRGRVRHPTEGQVPVWRIRAGDYVRVGDHPNDSPRRVISTRYSHQNREVSLEIGNTSAKLEAIMERLGAYLVGLY